MGVSVTEVGEFRAIDLYSGVGGWSLGLRLAGIHVVASYERWGAANETNFKNNGHQAQTVDIRRLALSDLPPDIDFVVGSPPCTEFSYSNRGGSGDLSDGLQDIKCFLRIVDHLKPQLWVMENVPRVAKILAAELKPDGELAEFAHLGCVPHVVDMALFGLPQRRRRCIAGNFNMELLNSYLSGVPQATLGDVVTALAQSPVIDPLYGLEVPRVGVVDHVEEDFLSEEEARINRANKTLHPVYNGMPFPDRLDRPVRTITATCTRVSRESTIIEAPQRPGSYRRLTLRERATLQGFPINFQFYGTNYGQKLRMIGNAVPPAFAYLIGHCLRGTAPAALPSLQEAGSQWTPPDPLPVETRPERAGSKFPLQRNFRFSIPSLHLKSGVRFEFTNEFCGHPVQWRVAFYFGTPKAIRSIDLDSSVQEYVSDQMSQRLAAVVSRVLRDLEQSMGAVDFQNMQNVWAHRGPGGTRPFMVLDELDECGAKLAAILRDHTEEASEIVRSVIERKYGGAPLPVGHAKLGRNAAVILAGLLLGCTVNGVIKNRISPVHDSRAATPKAS
jgi:DNA (cytosine-5)-methyltransferase 1